MTRRDNIITEMVGKKFGYLTVTGFAFMRQGNSFWRCQCECKKECIISKCSLKAGTISCGCFRIYKNKQGESGLKKIYERYKNESKRSKKIFNLTLEEFKEITSKNCFYCGIKPEMTVSLRLEHDPKLMAHASYTYNGIDRIDSSRGYEKDNIVPCCKWCNYAKRDESVKNFKNHIDKIYKHLIQRK